MEEEEKEGGDQREQLLQRHKKEKKELQSKIQILKKTATKGDKKRKKEVQEEIAKLEFELSQKQEAELSQLGDDRKESRPEEDVVKAADDVDVASGKRVAKVTKAQKRRDKKAAEQKEREKYILEQEIENESGSRSRETRKIGEILKKEGLMIYEIEADGNCLYNAVDHQLREKGSVGYGVDRLRTAASNMMKSNVGDYLPFVGDSVTGDTMTESQFHDYCDKVANTTNWGGQVELRALSHVVKRPIRVVQADGPTLTMGEEYSADDALTVCYHRHMYSLGEHYNSVQTYEADEDT